MKKYAFLALCLILCTAMLVGCACSNGAVGTTPTTTATRPTTVPTIPTTAPTTAPTTMPETEPTTLPTTGTENGGMDATGETAGDNGIVGDDGTEATDNARSRGRRIPSVG